MRERIVSWNEGVRGNYVNSDTAAVEPQMDILRYMEKSFRDAGRKGWPKKIKYPAEFYAQERAFGIEVYRQMWAEECHTNAGADPIVFVRAHREQSKQTPSRNGNGSAAVEEEVKEGVYAIDLIQDCRREWGEEWYQDHLKRVREEIAENRKLTESMHRYDRKSVSVGSAQ